MQLLAAATCMVIVANIHIATQDGYLCASDNNANIFACTPDEFFYASEITGTVFEDAETTCSPASMKLSPTLPCAVSVPGLEYCNFNKSSCEFYADRNLQTNCNRTKVDFYIVKDVTCIPKRQVHHILCDSAEISANEDKLILLSPNYPNIYSAADCELNVKLAHDSNHNAIKFQFVTFHTLAEKCGQCDDESDYLELDAGNGTRIRRCGWLQGKEAIVFTAGSNITLRFVAGNHRFYPPGFHIQVEAFYLESVDKEARIASDFWSVQTAIILFIVFTWVFLGMLVLFKVHVHAYDGYKTLQAAYYKKKIKKKLRKLNRVSSVISAHGKPMPGFEETDEVIKALTREYYNT